MDFSLRKIQNNITTQTQVQSKYYHKKWREKKTKMKSKKYRITLDVE